MNETGRRKRLEAKCPERWTYVHREELAELSSHSHDGGQVRAQISPSAGTTDRVLARSCFCVVHAYSAPLLVCETGGNREDTSHCLIRLHLRHLACLFAVPALSTSERVCGVRGAAAVSARSFKFGRARPPENVEGRTFHDRALDCFRVLKPSKSVVWFHPPTLGQPLWRVLCLSSGRSSFRLL